VLVVRVIVAKAIADQAFLAVRLRGPMRKGAIEVDLDHDIAEIKQKSVDAVARHAGQICCYEAA
jgi:hypothetical protein